MRLEAGFADVVAAIQRLPWIHVSITNPGGESRQAWGTLQGRRLGLASKDWTEYYDHKLKVHYSYDVGEKVSSPVP